MNALSRLFLCLFFFLCLFLAGDFIVSRFNGGEDGKPNSILHHVGCLIKEARRSGEISSRNEAVQHRLKVKNEVVESLVDGKITVREAYNCFVELEAESIEWHDDREKDAVGTSLLSWTKAVLTSHGKEAPEFLARVEKEIQELNSGYMGNAENPKQR